MHCLCWYYCRLGAKGDPCMAIISDLLCVPIWFMIFPNSSTRTLWQLSAETTSSEQMKPGERWPPNFAYEVSLFILLGTLALLAFDGFKWVVSDGRWIEPMFCDFPQRCRNARTTSVHNSFVRNSFTLQRHINVADVQNYKCRTFPGIWSTYVSMVSTQSGLQMHWSI
jgi:hypothetical protein